MYLIPLNYMVKMVNFMLRILGQNKKEEVAQNNGERLYDFFQLIFSISL